MPLTPLNDVPSNPRHLPAEAVRGATADRVRFIGDPAFVSVDVSKLLAPAPMAHGKALLAARKHGSALVGNSAAQ